MCLCIHMCVTPCVQTCVCATACLWRLEDHFWKSVLSFYLCETGSLLFLGVPQTSWSLSFWMILLSLHSIFPSCLRNVMVTDSHNYIWLFPFFFLNVGSGAQTQVVCLPTGPIFEPSLPVFKGKWIDKMTTLSPYHRKFFVNVLDILRESFVHFLDIH